MNQTTKKTCIGALLLAVGVLLPQIFHLVGGPVAGSMFLPMHIPVLLGGFLLGPAFGSAVGILTPVLSFLITGMPAAAKLPFMLFELLAYGLVAGLFAQKKINVYLGLITSQVAGRVASAVSMFVALHLFGAEVSPWTAATTALVTGLPGIAVQLVLIPPVVFLLRKVIRIEYGYKHC